MTSSSSRPSLAANLFVTPDLIGGLFLRHTRLLSVTPGSTGCPVMPGPDRASQIAGQAGNDV